MSEESEIEVFNSIERIPREDWDSVAGETVGLNYMMLLCREANYTGLDKPRYFLVRATDTVMAVGVAVVYSYSKEGLITQRLFGRLSASIKPIIKSLDRSLVCGRIPGPGAPIVTRPDSDHPHWIRVICRAMEDYASSKNLHMSYTGILPEQSILSQELKRLGYLQGIDNPVAILDVTWHDQKTYLSELAARRKKYASTARTEIRRFQKSGIRISHWSGNNSAELYELLQSHDEVRNNTGFQFGPKFLDDLVSRLGNDFIVYVARKATTLVGVCAVFRRNEKALSWLVGINHAADLGNFTYFNLAYYYPFSEYPTLGIRRAYFGNAVQYAKYRRGCDIVGAQFFVKFRPSPLALMLWPIFVMHRFVFTRKFRAILNRGSNTHT